MPAVSNDCKNTSHRAASGRESVSVVPKPRIANRYFSGLGMSAIISETGSYSFCPTYSSSGTWKKGLSPNRKNLSFHSLK